MNSLWCNFYDFGSTFSRSNEVKCYQMSQIPMLVYILLVISPNVGPIPMPLGRNKKCKSISTQNYMIWKGWLASLSTVRWKGSEGSKQTKHTTRKLTPCWFQKCIFFENLPTPFFGNVCFVKFGTFSALLALPVMIREAYGQNVYETLPRILLSNASLVTKSCVARFVEGDAFNPSALSDCSTGPSPPLVHAKSTLSPSQASAGCPRAGLFCRFRSICEQTAHRSRKIRAQCERPPIHVLKTQVSFASAQ